MQHRAKVDPVLGSMFPELEAGGFTRFDQKVIFYSRVNALVGADDVVVDFGAGDGTWAGRLPPYTARLCTLKGKCRKVIGIDVQDSVSANPNLGVALRAEPGMPIPLDDASVDLIVSWAVFEHIEHAPALAAELRRILRPGGWLCAWTPNRWGYVGLAARLVPDRLHARLLPALAPGDQREAKDVFPTYYGMNTLRRIRRLFPAADFRDHSYVWNGPPVYHAGSRLVARLIRAYGRLAPAGLGQSLHVFMQRR